MNGVKVLVNITRKRKEVYGRQFRKTHSTYSNSYFAIPRRLKATTMLRLPVCQNPLRCYHTNTLVSNVWHYFHMDLSASFMMVATSFSGALYGRVSGIYSQILSASIFPCFVASKFSISYSCSFSNLIHTI